MRFVFVDDLQISDGKETFGNYSTLDLSRIATDLDHSVHGSEAQGGKIHVPHLSSDLSHLRLRHRTGI